jgi:hypothetical protein
VTGFQRLETTSGKTGDKTTLKERILSFSFEMDIQKKDPLARHKFSKPLTTTNEVKAAISSHSTQTLTRLHKSTLLKCIYSYRQTCWKRI